MILELKNISKKYRISRKENFSALHNIDLSFEKGEFVSIVGPSGCGKSTLLNIIAGLDTPTSGELLISGVSSRKFKEKQWDLYRKNNIGFIFQNFNLIEHLTALENVEIVMNLIGLNMRDRHNRALELLETVGLKNQANHRPSELSGGQKQRVAIARALANDPDIILADEPTGSLDTKTGKQIMNLIASVAKDKLIIMVTHNNSLAFEYSSRIIRLNDGEISSIEQIKDLKINQEQSKLKKKNKSMSFFEAFKLSLRNMGKKKGRIAITTLAGCIGIAGFALIMGLGNGANIYIDKQLNKFANANVLSVSKTVVDNSEGFEYKSVSNNANDYKDVFGLDEVIQNRVGFSFNNAIISSNNETSEYYFYSLGSDNNFSFLNEEITGKLPGANEVLINQGAARQVLKSYNINSNDYSKAIGKTINVTITITSDEKVNIPFTKELTISGIANELDISLKNVYYNYDGIYNWLKNTNVSSKTLYDYVASGFEIILDNPSNNKKVADYINDTKNGGTGGVMSAINGGSTNKEGFSAFSMPSVLKTIFARLISIAQAVISIFIIVALIVSSIMTSIVLYSSVVERKTEIGIIKAVGGRDKDVLRIFESEAMLMGAFSGIAGIALAYILAPIIEHLVTATFNLNLPGIVSIPLSKIPLTNIYFPFGTIISLILFSTIIAAIAGFLPSKRATKMQVVDALRDE